jgi:hypothetical protein
VLVRLFPAVATALFLLAGLPAGQLSASDQPEHGPAPAAVRTVAGPTDDTLNPFLPEDRSLGECISSVQKPGCGSEARGGWLIVDYGDVVLHLFSPDQRGYYNLEELWNEGKVLLRVQ